MQRPVWPQVRTVLTRIGRFSLSLSPEPMGPWRRCNYRRNRALTLGNTETALQRGPVSGRSAQQSRLFLFAAGVPGRPGFLRQCPVAHRLQPAFAGNRILWFGDAGHGLLGPARFVVAAIAVAVARFVVTPLATRRSSGRALLAPASARRAATGALCALRTVAVQLGLCRRNKALQVAFLELLTGHAFDGPQQLLLVRADQGNSFTAAPGTTGTTDAVNT